MKVVEKAQKGLESSEEIARRAASSMSWRIQVNIRISRKIRPTRSHLKP